MQIYALNGEWFLSALCSIPQPFSCGSLHWTPNPQLPVKVWRLMNRINQKGLRPQDYPRLFAEREREDQDFIKNNLPLLKNRRSY